MISIRWLGHSCFRIREGSSTAPYKNTTDLSGKSIIIDPHDGHSLGLKPPEESGDIILITHDHFDHNCYRVVQKSDSVVIREAGEQMIGPLTIAGYPAHHDNIGGKKRGDIIIYTIKVGGMKLCHLGDVGHDLGDDLVEKLASPDVLFIPVGGYFTIDAATAWRIVDELQPKVVVPMHYKIGGLSLHLDPIDNFLGMKETEKIMVGNEISFEVEDLPEKMELWVFSL